jgi:heat shock protein HtpX
MLGGRDPHPVAVDVAPSVRTHARAVIEPVEVRREKNRAAVESLTRWCAAVLVIPAVVVAILDGLITRSPIVAVITFVVVYGLLVGYLALHLRSSTTALLATPASAPSDPHRDARLHNLTEGLCVAHGLTKPELRVVATPACNAATIFAGRAAGSGSSNGASVDDSTPSSEVVLLVTRGLLDTLPAIELEGLLAQQLSHVRDGDTALSTRVAALGSLPLLGSAVVRRARAVVEPDLEGVADLDAASMTRYPPGLASALERLETCDTTIAGVTPLTAHLWLADPIAAAPGAAVEPTGATLPLVEHPPLAHRVAVLREL